MTNGALALLVRAFNAVCKASAMAVPTNRLQISNEIRRALSMFENQPHSVCRKAIPPRSKIDDLEAISVSNSRRRIAAPFRLLQFGARHRARGIDDEDHVLWEQVGLFRNCRRGQKQEVTIFAARFVRDEALDRYRVFPSYKRAGNRIRFLVLGLVTQ
jgi:hypothetical protein